VDRVLETGWEQSQASQTVYPGRGGKKGWLIGGARLSVPHLNEGVSERLGRWIKEDPMATGHLPCFNTCTGPDPSSVRLGLRVSLRGAGDIGGGQRGSEGRWKVGGGAVVRPDRAEAPPGFDLGSSPSATSLQVVLTADGYRASGQNRGKG
jgi:hypothetical protein